MKITILGAGGFIGSHLVEHLMQRAEHEIIGVDLEDAKLEGIRGSNFRFIRGDVHSVQTSLWKSADLVIDLIAYANPSIYVERPLDVFHTNFEANALVIEACIAHNCRLLQFSTSEVYGKAVDPVGTYAEDRTDLIYGPISKQRWIYAATKQLLERVIYAHGERGDLDYTIIRPFNFLGPRFDYLVPAGTTGGPRAFAHFMSALLTGGPIQLVDGGEQRRSFTDIRDATAAVSAMIDAGEAASGQIYNVGNPDNDVAIRELVDKMMQVYEELTGRAPTNEIRTISGEDFYGVGYEDMTRQPPDISKLQTLGWNPRFDLDTTLRHAMPAYIDEGGAPATSDVRK
jgi:UDP-apiose/xylose synthase